ncbi:SDR family oxidoreductase [Alkalicoccobacillus murimartini]|uniref:NAD(P)-dependent dehydrogenase (Short-subunit alcohol dehydrogenase family) n=1 Tax=Alkalicoccobacillus murimartini TaxID=171685 RepID=A0ABT9YJ01_9BACI|nr:SDR family oxidoreductase [Alkalicoccobacillus murimartini]MDQ0207845.1 NAD(P)-dependent dehydrogenase (short-subunit alcohol dehydrogenase family) [Alkalicoccobacillus murimartini]
MAGLEDIQNKEEQMKQRPAQTQKMQPGFESDMTPEPLFDDSSYIGSGKLKGKTAFITGGDSGIGRAVAIAFAKEGANVSIAYLNEHSDAEKTKELVEEKGVSCMILSGDVGEESFCKHAISKTVEAYNTIDILVNNAAEQHYQENIEDISSAQLHRTFQTNIFSYFYIIQAAMPHLKKGSSIINSASIVAYKGNPVLMDYAATKGAIVALTRSLAVNLIEKGIRVNGVAPGPIWTPLIPASFPAEDVANFGNNAPMKRAGQPAELAPAYVYLASDDSSYVSGQMMHVNGGSVING